VAWLEHSLSSYSTCAESVSGISIFYGVPLFLRPAHFFAANVVCSPSAPLAAKGWGSEKT